jgi:hypothetical protein
MMRSASVGDPIVTVSPAAKVNGLRGDEAGWTAMVVAPAVAAAASVLEPGVRRYC